MVTLKFMNGPKYAKGKNSFETASKLNKLHLIWYPLQTNEEYRKTFKMTFNIWMKKSNSKFSSVSRPVK